MTAPASRRLGEVILGKYRLLRVVGEGGMGLVYAAHHLGLDNQVAMKILNADVAKETKNIARFVNEARLAAKIKSPNVCQVMDVGTLEDGRPYLVMELLEGQDLASILRGRGTLSPVEACAYTLQALEGLAHAHGRGIIHRDLKPSNLFVAHEEGSPPAVKILDFGVSKLDDSDVTGSGQLTSARVILGSPAYMSPEQIRDARTVDARGDIWSMGVILYELLTGICPFDAETPGAIFTRIVSESDNPSPISNVRPDCPPVLDQVVGRCIRRKREERFTNVLEVASAIAPLLGPAGGLAVDRIAAALARPRAATNITDSSGAVSRVSEIPHPTNVSWAGSARSGSSRMAVGAALGLGTFAVVAAIAVAAHRRHASAPPAASMSVSSATAVAEATVPEVIPMPPAPSDSAAPDAGVAASPSPVPRSPRAHPPKPSKQDLLKDRR